MDKKYQIIQKLNNQDVLQHPLITIITVVFNEVKYIEETILSVINQTYKKIEYIIIDGGSNDGTVDILKKYDKRIDYWVSEHDKGLYDAYNKAIMISSGDYLNFMDGGDKFYTDHAIKDVVDKFLLECKDADLIYGDMIKEDLFHKTTSLFKARSLKTLNRIMSMGCHTIFVRGEIAKKHKFDIRYKISADYNFVVTCYLENYKFYNSEILSACFRFGGISSKKSIRIIIEDYFVQRRLDTTINLKIYVLKRIYRWAHYKIFYALDKNLPGKYCHNIMRKFNKKIKIHLKLKQLTYFFLSKTYIKKK